MIGKASFDGKYIKMYYPTPMKSGMLEVKSTPTSIYQREWGMSLSLRRLLGTRLKENKIQRLPIGSRVYFPKHITFPRSRFRHWAKQFNADITQKLELATVMVVDPFFVYKMFNIWGHRNSADRPRGIVYHVKHPHKLEEFHISTQAWSLLQKEFHPYLVHEQIQQVTDYTKADLEGLDHLIDCIVQRPDLKLITYDWLNDRVADQELEDIDELFRTLNLIRTAGAGHIVKMGLNWIATLNPKKYEFMIWSTVNLIRKFTDQDMYMKSNLHNNIMYRTPLKMAKIYFGTTSFGRATSYVEKAMTGSEPIETLLHRSVSGLLSKFTSGRRIKRVPTCPLWFAEWWVRKKLDDYMEVQKDNVFLCPVGKMLPIQERLDVLARYFTGNDQILFSTKDLECPSKLLGLDLEVLLRYLIQNYEQEEPVSGTRLGTDLCGKVAAHLPYDSDLSE